MNFNDSLIKTHLLYVSPDWVPDRGARFDAARLAELLEEGCIGAAELYCKDVHGINYYPARTGLGEPYPRDVVGELVAAAHARDIKLIAYYCVGWDGRAGRQHPEWVMRDAQGNAQWVGNQFPWTCINTGYRQFALDQIAELIDKYDADGLFIDVFVDNISGGCYCPDCERLFLAKYGTPQPRDLTVPENIAAVKQFQAGSYLDFLERVASGLKARRPGALLTFNGVGGITADTTRFTRLVDWISVEAHAPFFFQQSRTCKLLRGQGKPFEIMTAGCCKSIREGGPSMLEGMGDWVSFMPKPVCALKLEAAVALAHGGTVTFGLNVHPDGSVPPQEVRPLQEVGRWIAERRDVFEGSAPESDAVILWNEKTFAAASLDVEKRFGALAGDLPLQGLHAGLLGNHTQFDMMRFADTRLEAYKLVLLPENLVTSMAEEERLRAYVAGGGTLLACHSASLLDDMGRKRANFGLADVFGLDYAGSYTDGTTYVQPTATELKKDLLDIRMMMRGEAIRPRLGSAEPLASYAYPIAERTDEHYVWPTFYNPPGPLSEHAAITLNRFGKGRCLYVAFPLATNVAQRSDADPRPAQLFCNVVNLLLPGPFLRTNAPHQVEVLANRWHDGYAIHLMNYYGAFDGHYCLGDRLPALGGLYLALDMARLPEKYRLQWAAGAEKVAARQEDGWLRVELPLLADHMALLITPAES